MRSSLLKPLELLADDAQRFVRLPASRLLYVEADSRLFDAAMQTLLATEHLADNASPLVPVTVAGDAEDDRAWDAEADALRSAHAKQCEAGAPLNPLEGRPMGPRGSANFATAALQCLGSVTAPAKGLLLLLIARRGCSATWRQNVAQIAMSEESSGARFICLATPEEAVSDWLEAFEPGTAVHNACVVDDQTEAQELKAEVEAEETMPQGGRGAWPNGVRPPPRPNAAGVPIATKPGPDSAQSRARQLEVKKAAVAMRTGDGPEAIRCQAAARDACIENGDMRDAVSMEMILGSYMLQLEQIPLALRAFEAAAERAAQFEHPDLVAQSRCALGSTHDTDSNPTAAVREYHRAIAAAREAEEVQLALAAYWEAGQVALRLGLEVDAIASWLDAMTYAVDAGSDKLAGSRAPDIARELSVLLAKHRRYSDAREVDRAAASFPS